MAPMKPDLATHPTACPCGSALAYTACCGRWHAGPEHLQAPTAEALMRSRYSAYVREGGRWFYRDGEVET